MALRDWLKAYVRHQTGQAENIAQLITGGLAEIPAGLSGIAGLVSGGAEEGARRVQATRDRLTYQPRSKAAKAQQASIARLVAPVTGNVERGRQKAGEWVLDRTGSPVAATAVSVLPEALLALSGAPAAKQTLSGVVNVARNAARMEAPVMGSPAAQLGIFAGPKAATADIGAMNRAASRLALGADPREVWRTEGWFRGPDGKMRFEIDDSQAKAVEYPNGPREAYDQEFYGSQWNPERHWPANLEAAKQYIDTSTDDLLAQWKAIGAQVVEKAQAGDAAGALKLLESRQAIDNALTTRRNRERGPYSAFVNHEQLYDAYPDAGEIPTYVGEHHVSGGAIGSYQPETPTLVEHINLRNAPNNYAGDGISTPLHEMQHAIQRREGFATGGNTKNAREAATAQANHGGLNLELYDDHALYQRLAGEAEARAVQKRMDYTPQQRRDIYPLDDYDVPLDELIIRGNRDGGPQMSIPDYGMAHRPPMRDSGAPLHDVTGSGAVYPDDIYSAQGHRLYGHGDDAMDRATMRLIQSFRNNPDAMIPIYRAVPKGMGTKGINRGDWVTINRRYAESHGEGFDEGFDIIEQRVPARHIFTNGDSIHEWGYDPD